MGFGILEGPGVNAPRMPRDDCIQENIPARDQIPRCVLRTMGKARVGKQFEFFPLVIIRPNYSIPSVQSLIPYSLA